MSERPATASPARTALAPLRLVLRWAPVWVPAILLWQVSTRGLVPALGESERLRGAAPEVDARHARAVREHEELRDLLRAWQDEVFRARMRRVWAREEAPPPPPAGDEAVPPPAGGGAGGNDAPR